MPAQAGERRTVSVLMVDVADSTTIGERLGPERSKFLFDEVVRLMAGAVERFGGTVAQLSGDGLYALFGAPVAHDDDAERAVRAGLAIHEALATYAQDVGDAYGIELAARVGVNTGLVVLVPEDAPAEERYNALGDTVNVAARLQTHAGVGGIAVGSETARHLSGVFELESLGALDLKGKADRLEASLIVGERGDRKGTRSPLVAREAELAALTDALDALLDGRGAIVAITGEAGIGKSRLAVEARDRYADRVRFLEAQAVSFAEEIPYYPLRSLLRGWLGLGLDDPEARVRLELKTSLAGVLGDRGEVAYPFIGTLLGLDLEPGAREAVDLAPDAVKLQTHRILGELVTALARERALCLVLEDLHAADEPTLELVEELLPLTDGAPVLFVLLYRSDPDNAAWDLGEHARRHHRHRFSELALEPLDAEASASLAESAAGAELPETVAKLLTERTGGNPFFLEEALADLVEQGSLRRVNNHVELTVPESALTLPSAVLEALQARLDRLTPEARELAAVTSVVGARFGTQLLERLVPRQRLAAGLSELQRLELVVEAQRRPSAEYRFRHGLVRQAAYEGLLREDRRTLHLRVGTALEQLVEEDVAVAPGTLAHHFAEADDAERAARYLLAAGDAARAVYADEEAIASWRRALAFLDRLGDFERVRAALCKIALSHHLSFDFEHANQAWADAAARPGPSPRRLEPTERLRVFADAPTVEGPHRVTPGYAYDLQLEDRGTPRIPRPLPTEHRAGRRPRPRRRGLGVLRWSRIPLPDPPDRTLERRPVAHGGRLCVHPPLHPRRPGDRGWAPPQSDQVGGGAGRAHARAPARGTVRLPALHPRVSPGGSVASPRGRGGRQDVEREGAAGLERPVRRNERNE
jgi:class 3 adenylate cyclase